MVHALSQPVAKDTHARTHARGYRSTRHHSGKATQTHTVSVRYVSQWKCISAEKQEQIITNSSRGREKKQIQNSKQSLCHWVTHWQRLIKQTDWANHLNPLFSVTVHPQIKTLYVLIGFVHPKKRWPYDAEHTKLVSIFIESDIMATKCFSFIFSSVILFVGYFCYRYLQMTSDIQKNRA